jgi:hypothetical protein
MIDRRFTNNRLQGDNFFETGMDAKPVLKYNSRNEAYFQCPHANCDWGFQFAVGRQAASPKIQYARFRAQLDKEFADHVCAKHSKPATG